MSSKIQILVPCDWTNKKRGDFFEDLVGTLFKQMQFKVVERVRVTGMEIDLIADHLYDKQRAFVECKFQSTRFGAPILHKLWGKAMVREDVDIAYLVSASGPGKDAKGLLVEHDKNNLIRGVLRFAYVGPTELADLYLEVNGYPSLETRLRGTNLKRERTAATLVITPDEACWVLEQRRGGVPKSAFAVPVAKEATRLRDYDMFKKLREENEVWPGLTIHNGPPTAAVRTPSEGRRVDVVTQIPVSERFDDYNPARPEDFVGRTELQKEFLDFLSRVRRREAYKRIVALTGPSGFGKSSVVLKLADRVRNQYYRNRFYIYHVDSRSATSPLFVAEALKVAFQSAIDDGFIDILDLDVSVESVEDPFSSSSMEACLTDLAGSERVLVIFFDQFEELLTKESLLATFELFKKTAFMVESLQANLVLGFSWRTGISFPEGHPAYHMWHSLGDKRIRLRVGLFSDAESSEMIGVLQERLGRTLGNPLRRHLLEQAQNFPWLLKKLCIHVYRQLSKGTSERALIERKLDAAVLFREDTCDLSSTELSCLKYIAEHSPVDLVEVHETFKPEVAERLYHSRLVVKSGYKYSVYWDIFKEYLTSDGQVPDIPMTFFPQAQLTTSLSVLRYIAEEGPVTAEAIDSDFSYTIKTVWNILGDLQAFFLVHRTTDGEFAIIKELEQEQPFEEAVAEYAAQHLERHIVLREFCNAVQPGEGMSQDEIESRMSQVYPSIKASSLHTYMNRILSWLRFAGLVELEPPDQVIRPTGMGKDKGNVVIRHPRLIDGKAVFLCTSSPTQVIELAVQLLQHGRLSRDYILESASRNTAQDLTSLGLAEWRNRYLHPAGDLAELDADGEDLNARCASAVKRHSLESRFVQSLSKHIGSGRNKTKNTVMGLVSQDLGREWHPSSALRYWGGGVRWLRFFGKLQELRGQLSFEDVLNEDGPTLYGSREVHSH